MTEPETTGEYRAALRAWHGAMDEWNLTARPVYQRLRAARDRLVTAVHAEQQAAQSANDEIDWCTTYSKVVGAMTNEDDTPADDTTAAYRVALREYQAAVGKWNFHGEPQSGPVFDGMWSARERYLTAMYADDAARMADGDRQ